MDENSQWYYTDSNGQQAGPVGLAELRALAASGQASRESMVWSEGMENWSLASQVDGLLPPKPSVPVPAAPSQAPVPQPSRPQAPSAANPYAPPQTQVTNLETAGYQEPVVYPGIKRLGYFGRVLILVLLFIAGLFITGSLASGIGEPSLILLLIGMLVFVVLYVRFALLRIRNMGASGWWLLLMLVPIASNVLSIALLSCPEGFAHHKKMDTPGIVVACILGGLTLLSFVGNFVTAFG